MTVQEKIIICIKKVKGDYFDQTEQLLTGGWIDSFELLKLIQEIEDEFSVKLSLNQVSPQDFDSVERIEKLLLIDNTAKRL